MSDLAKYFERALERAIEPIGTRRREERVIGHDSYESFVRAVAPPMVRCLHCRGFADDIDHVRGCPKLEPISASAARAGLLAAFRSTPQHPDDPPLATDPEIRACSRLAAGAGGAQ